MCWIFSFISYTKAFFLTVVAFCFLATPVQSQFWGQASSSDGYTVDFLIAPTTIDAPASCPTGYNFNVNLLYVISLSGSNIPDSLTTLWGEVDCGSYTVNTFELPKEGGTGTSRTNTSPFRSAPDCLIATPATLFCLTIRVYVSGPGMPEEEVILTGSLPITMGSFEADVRDNSVDLAWTTLSESNNSYFSIERSDDLSNWNSIGEVDGAGNSQLELAYSYTDSAPLNGTSYYRIRQTDFNGASTHSTTLSVEMNSIDRLSIQVHPNPTTDHLTLSSTEQLNGPVLILDQVGSVVARIETEAHGNSSIRFSVAHLDKGMYTLLHETHGIRFIKR